MLKLKKDNMKKAFISLIFFSLFLISCIPTQEITVSTKLLTKAEIIHNNVLTLDTHADTPLRLLNPEFDINKENDPVKTHSKIDFPRMKEGGLDATFINR